MPEMSFRQCNTSPAVRPSHDTRPPQHGSGSDPLQRSSDLASPYGVTYMERCLRKFLFSSPPPPPVIFPYFLLNKEININQKKANWENEGEIL